MEILGHKKGKVFIIGSIFVSLLICLFISDDWQQRRMATLRSGYHHMMKKEYDKAVIEFQEYLDVDSQVYWMLMETINNEFYSRDGVNEAISICIANTK